MNEFFERMKMEKDSIPNQMAVIGYLKLSSIERYLAAKSDVYLDVADLLHEARKALYPDLHIDSLRACQDFLIHATDWTID